MSVDPVEGRPDSRDLGGYVVDSKLGQGGMGAVFRVHHPRFPGQAFALKVLAGEGLAADAVARFRREMQALSAVSGHPNIVKVHGGRVDGPSPYFVMELVAGQSLTKLAAGHPLEPGRAVTIVRAVAGAIEHAHAQGVLHRDLKPDNVMVEPSAGAPGGAVDRVRVCDFGLATLAGESRLTQSNASMGTAAYSAPEQLDGRAKQADARADVYALGGILHFTLSGRAPFEGSGVQLLKRVLVDPAPALRSQVTGVPLALELVCLHALEKHPEQRYPTVAALREDLDRFLAGEPVSVKPLTSGERFRRWRKRRRLRLIGLAVLIAAVLVTAGGLVGVRSLAHQREIAAALESVASPAASAAKLGEALKRLEQAHASVEKQSEVRRRLHARAAEESDTATPAAFDELMQGLADTGADPRTIENAWARRYEREVTRATGGKRVIPKDALRTLVRYALHASRAVNLVGEDPTRFALGDQLLVCRDGPLLDEAEKLARARLEAGDDLPARALRAYTALAQAKLPTRPLGVFDAAPAPGAIAPGVSADLEAAARLEGAAGERAGWLLVDLALLSAGDDAARAARASVGLHARPASPEALALAKVLDLAPDATGYAAARDALASGDPLAAAALSRFCVRCGSPLALEHPELARLPDEAPDKANERIAALAAATSTAFELRSEGITRAPPEAPLPDGKTLAGANWHARLLELSFTPAPDTSAVDAELGAVLEHWGTDPAILMFAGHTVRHRLSSPVFWLLAARPSLMGFDWIMEAFSSFARDRANEHSAVVRADSKSHEGERAPWDYDPALWASADEDAVAGCARFDARLDDALAHDPLIASARRGGLSEGTLADAALAVKGLRRLEVLVEADPAKLEPAARDRLVFDALRQIDGLRRLGGPLVLPFRARLRLLAAPGPLGEALARLDFERAFRFGLEAPDPGDLARNGFDTGSLPEYFVYCFAATSELTGNYKAPLPTRFLQMAAAWEREKALIADWGLLLKRPFDPVADRHCVNETLAEFVKNTQARAWFPQSILIGQDSVLLTDSLRPSDADWKRLGQVYSFDRKSFLLDLEARTRAAR